MIAPPTTTTSRPGAVFLGEDLTRFRVWAPHASFVEVALVGDTERHEELEPRGSGYFESVVDRAGPGTLYRYRLDGRQEVPDPASLSQPMGVHGPSEVVSLSYPWSDAAFWNHPLDDYVIYELHVGTFTSEGTFDSARGRLGHLADLGVTAVELMPVAQNPGSRNWGYDGVYLYAPQRSYGGVEAMQRFVDDCHRHGMAVVLDVVYNHLGPEGNYLHTFGPYFTDAYHTPWGSAVNLDRRGSDQVREFFIENALMWISDFHVDALRLDAIHALYDQSAHPFLAELAEAVHERGERLERDVYLIAENPLNDPKVVRPRRIGGLGLDGLWNEDLHHSLHVALTGEDQAYYQDFEEPIPDLAQAIAHGFVNNGRYSPYAGHRVGAPSDDLPRSSLVVYGQNHDQVGNRPLGDRLSTLVDPARLRFAASVVLLTPWIPLLFMGEEWGETNPFLYFVDHGDPELREAVRRGRSEEFAGFFASHQGSTLPDPSDPETRERSVLDWSKLDEAHHRQMRDLYRELIRQRRRLGALRDPDPESHTVARSGSLIRLLAGRERVLVVWNAGELPAQASAPAGDWRLVLDGSDPRFGGGGFTASLRAGGGDLLRLDGWGFHLYESE